MPVLYNGARRAYLALQISGDKIGPRDSRMGQRLLAFAPNAQQMMQGQTPAIIQKSLWLVLSWKDAHANLRSVVWRLGITRYGRQWWRPQTDRFLTQHALRARFPEVLIDGWYHQGKQANPADPVDTDLHVNEI